MTSSVPLRVIIAEDEPLARQALQRFLATDGQVTVVGEAEDVPSLRTLLRTQTADLLFLDITMPGGTGLDAVPLVPQNMSIVFTTAHAEYAATAYEIDAVDYLVKPFGHDRVREALLRVRRARAARETAPAPLTLIIVRTGSQLTPVPTSGIWRLEGCDDFVRVVTAAKSWLHGTTLSTLNAQLDANTFVRVHRSHVVNLAHVRRMLPRDERRLAVEFPDGTQILCSRAGSAELRRRTRAPER
jgi:two-component system, LytTR family, response regulator